MMVYSRKGGDMTESNSNPYIYETTETVGTWLEVLKADWTRFKEVAGRCVDHKTFHEANQTLGYSLAKACPALILEMENRQGYYNHLHDDMLKVTTAVARADATIAKLQAPLYTGKWWED
jgi:hypothetical protein